jgi:hypothetical protein
MTLSVLLVVELTDIGELLSQFAFGTMRPENFEKLFFAAVSRINRRISPVHSSKAYLTRLPETTGTFP